MLWKFIQWANAPLRTLLLLCPLLTFFGCWVCWCSSWFVVSNLIRAAMFRFEHPGSVCCAASYHSYSVSLLFFYTCHGNAYSGECKEMSKQHKKYHVVFKYGAPHKLRTLIPDNAVEVFQNHISSCGSQSPSFLIGAVRVSNEESVLYCCSSFPFTQISPDQNAQSCLIMLLNKQWPQF